MTKLLCTVTVAAFLCATSLSSAMAEDAFYLGQWKITGAAPAPWIKSDAELFPDEMKSLVGQTITIKADAIEGPGGFPCKGPKYEVMQGGPDMLFQGGFGEMQAQNAASDPQKLAEQVGFNGTDYKTVLTGCEFAVDFSIGADQDTMMFALDNAVYTMKRQ
jgi:hypothetical protein